VSDAARNRSLADLSEPELIASVFIACAARVTRLGRSYDEWLGEVNRRFGVAWKVIDTGSPHASA
jgi:hypothetical protein